MLDLFLSLAATTAQVQIIAQAKSTIYLPVSTSQSSRKNCVTYTATNSTGRSVSDVSVNRRDSRGEIYQSFLTTSLVAGKTVAFDVCEGYSFVNVESKQ